MFRLIFIKLFSGFDPQSFFLHTNYNVSENTRSRLRGTIVSCVQKLFSSQPEDGFTKNFETRRCYEFLIIF